MVEPNRNVDQAYYGSRTKLNLRGTREGSRNPQPIPGYKQQATDGITSSDKYYAASQPKVIAAAAATPRTLKTLRLKTAKTVLTDLVSLFGSGATEVVVYGTAEQINSARVSTELAVGRKTLTRAQADAVQFQIETAPVPHEPEVAPKLVANQQVTVAQETAEEEITSEDIAAAFSAQDSSDN